MSIHIMLYICSQLAIIGQQARIILLWFLWQDQTSTHNHGKCLGNSQTSWSQAFPNIKGNDRKSTMYIFAMRFYFVKGHCTVEVAMNYQTIWIVKVWLLLGQCTSTIQHYCIHSKAEAIASIESREFWKASEISQKETAMYHKTIWMEQCSQ